MLISMGLEESAVSHKPNIIGLWKGLMQIFPYVVRHSAEIQEKISADPYCDFKDTEIETKVKELCDANLTNGSDPISNKFFVSYGINLLAYQCTRCKERNGWKEPTPNEMKFLQEYLYKEF